MNVDQSCPNTGGQINGPQRMAIDPKGLGAGNSKLSKLMLAWQPGTWNKFSVYACYV